MATVVTGGAGFVGGHLVERLVAEGRSVVVIDNLVTGQIGNLETVLSGDKAKFVFADISTDVASLRRILADASVTTIDEIYHLASPASPDAYGRLPWETLRVNSIGTMSLVELALEHKARFILASTSEIYGDPLEHPQREGYFGNVNSVGPRACYDEGKRFAEAAVSSACTSLGLDGRIVRIFNCYGPRMSVGDGRLIPSLMEAALKGGRLPIHGDGSQSRTMTYIDDLIDGIRTVARWEPPALQPINLGADIEMNVREIASAVARVAGIPCEFEYLDARPEDPQRRKPDLTLSRSIGWKSKWTIEDGLARTYEWFGESGATLVARAG